MIEWQTDPETAFAELGQAYADEITRGVFAICKGYAPEIENWMKANAAWTDRTSNARQSLWSDADMVAQTTVELIMSHGMGYGKWLELLHAGKYAVIAPALDYFAPRVWADVVRMLR